MIAASTAISPALNSTLSALLSYRSAQQPRQRAYSFLADGERCEETLNYGELDFRARQWAIAIGRRGDVGDRMLLLLQPGLELISAFFGTMHSGLVAVPTYPPHGRRSLPRLQAIIEDARPTVVVTNEAARPSVESLIVDTHSIEILTPDGLDANNSGDWQPPPIRADSIAMLQYTSGATAQPRGVMLTHRNLLHNSAQICERFRHTPDSCGVIWLPPYHDMGLIGGILQPLYAGFPVVLMSPLDVVQQPVRWLRAISRFRATTSGGPNFVYEMCIDRITDDERAELDLSSWDVAFTGAEPVRAATLDRFHEAFAACGFRRQAWYPCYGLAESTLMVSGGEKSQPPRTLSIDADALATNQVVQASDGRRLVGCGRPWRDQQIAIVDPETCLECPPEQVGEVWVCGPSVAAGYWNRPDESESTFNAFLANTGDGPFLRTGDLGLMHDGELFLTGRLKDLIIIDGRNHYPHDIELAMEQAHAAVQPGGCAAFSLERDGEEVLAAIAEIKRAYCKQIAVADERQMIVKAIRRKVFELHQVRPAAVEFVRPASLAKTTSGKMRRHVCRAEYLAGTLKLI